MAAPEPIPREANNEIIDARWATSGTVVEPSAGRKDTGWLNGDTVTEGENNWLGATPFDIGRAFFASTVPTSSSFGASWLYPGTTTPLELLGTWSDTGVPVLNGFLSDAVGTDTRVVDVWLDPEGNGATAIQVKVTSASPFLFTANRDHYFFVDLTDRLAQIGSGITVIDVPVGDPAPATPAGTVPVWRVETDGVGIVDQEILVPTFPVLKQVGFEIVSAADLMIQGDLDVGGTAEFDGDVFVDDGGSLTMVDSSTLTIEGDLGNGGSLLVTGVGSTSTFNGDVIVGGLGSLTVNSNADFMNDVTLGDVVGDVITVNGTTTFNENVSIAAAKTFSGGAGSTCGPFSLVQGSTLDTGNTGVAQIQHIDWYQDATPPISDGEEAWDGYRKSLGNGTSAQPIYAPFVGYETDDSTVNALDDLGSLTVTLEIPPTREVLIELFANQEVDTATEVPKLEIKAENAGAVDVVTRLKNLQADQAISPLPATVSANDRRPNSILIVWRPDDDVPVPNNDTWTIIARHGVTGGATLTSTNAVLRVTYR